MNINATLFGQIVVVLALIMAGLCYYLGKRKTQTPLLAAVVGVLTAFIPPLALLYLAALVLKNDIRLAGQDLSLK